MSHRLAGRVLQISFFINIILFKLYLGINMEWIYKFMLKLWFLDINY